MAEDQLQSGAINSVSESNTQNQPTQNTKEEEKTTLTPKETTPAPQPQAPVAVQDDESFRAERKAIAKDVQQLLTKKLEKHEIEPSLAKEIALRVVEELKGAKTHYELEVLIPHLSEEFAELKDILMLEIKHRRQDLDMLISKIVSELIHHERFQEAIAAAKLADFEGESLEDFDDAEAKVHAYEQGDTQPVAPESTASTDASPPPGAIAPQTSAAQPAPTQPAPTQPPNQPTAPEAPATPQPSVIQPTQASPQSTPQTPPPAPQNQPVAPATTTPNASQPAQQEQQTESSSTAPQITTQTNPNKDSTGQTPDSSLPSIAPTSIPMEGSTAGSFPPTPEFPSQVPPPEVLQKEEPTLTDKLQKGIGKLKPLVQQATEKAKETASHLGEKASELAQQTQQKIKEQKKNQPEE